MESGWPNVRYWMALCVATALALLVLSGFGMGGPQGGPANTVMGWLFVASMLAAPAVIWWTRRGTVAPYLQYLLLTVGCLVLASFAFLALYS